MTDEDEHSLEPAVQPDEVQLYSEGQVSVAAFLGGPLAAGWLMSRNYKSLLHSRLAPRAIQFALAGVVIVVLLALALPTDFPNLLIPLLTAVIARLLYRKYQKGVFDKHKDGGGAVVSNWRVVGSSLLIFALTLIIITPLAIVLPITPWNSVEIETNTVYYEGAAQRSDAENLGSYFSKQGIFTTDSFMDVTLLYPRGAAESVIIKAPFAVPEDGTEYQTLMSSLVADLAGRYQGREFELHLQNAFGLTEKVLKTE